MTECSRQRLQCQALLSQLRESHNVLKSQFFNAGNGSTIVTSVGSSPTTASSTTASSLAKPQSGILKTSSSVPSYRSTDKALDFDLNNSATVEKYGNISRGKYSSSKVLMQGISSSSEPVSNSRGKISSTSAAFQNSWSTDTDRRHDVTDAKQAYDTRQDCQNNLITGEREMSAVEKGFNVAQKQSSSELSPASTSPQTWRQILNKHVTVPSQLSTQELKELDSVRGLNFSYSGGNSDSHATESHSHSKAQSAAKGRAKIKHPAVCKDITNQPVRVSLDDMVTKKDAAYSRKDDENKDKLSSNSDKESERKRVQFFHQQLEDKGNNRKLNSFIKDASVKPKSLLNSTGYRSLCSSKQSAPDSRTFVEDQRLLGYDWIAALLDNDPDLMNQSESFFNELKDFRRAYKSECSNQFYKESPHNLVEFEAQPVVEALTETKVHPYIVNERLFTEPFKSGLIDYSGDDKREKRSEGEIKQPSEENPRFVRVSIPRSTLSTPYKAKPHRRRSFDGSESCSLMDHCLLGWENTRPAMIPTAKSLDLNSEAGTRVDSQVTTLSEAEKMASKFSHAEWPFTRPTPRSSTLPTWRKYYMDTTLNLSRVSVPSDGANSSAAQVMGGSSRLQQDVKRSTDAILKATYSTMYEMERLRKERELEMAAMREGK